jgi:hypothetical protein
LVKRYVFILWIGALLAALFFSRPVAGALAVGLFVWLAYETRQRQRFRFLAKHREAERVLTLGPDLHLALASRTEAQVLTVEHGPVLSLHAFNSGALLWRRPFEAAPQAVLCGPGGRLYYATETELVSCDAQGHDGARLAFEPPLFRQSYSLHLSADGGTLALQTPWFIQFAAPDLSRLGQRIRYEEAGHYLKYAALSADGKGLLLAGALLLEESEEATAGMEARWDYWTCDTAGLWTQAWAKAYESYNNSHLRGVAIQGRTLLAEVYQQGYEFRLYQPDGRAVWERPGGERAVLSPNGEYILWQSHFEGLQLSRVADKQQLWARKSEEQWRLKAVDDQGRCFLLEGRHLLVLDSSGQVRWEDWFKHDPSQFSLGPQGRLCVALDAKAGFIQVPFDR